MQQPAAPLAIVRSPLATGLAMAMLGSIAFSGKAIIVKLAYRHGVDAVTLLMLRMALALPFFISILWWVNRSHPSKLVLNRHDYWGIVWLGVTGYYLASFMDFAGLQYISASLERLILYLNPTIVLLLGLLLYQKKVSRYQWIGMAVSYAGVLAVFGHEVGLQGADVFVGSVLVFCSAISYAFYLSYSGELVKLLGSLRLVGMATCVACGLCVVQFLCLRSPALLLTLPAEVWGLSLINATLCTVVPVLLVMMAIERIGAPLASQVGMVGPMSTLTMAGLILGEPMTVWIVAGTILVLLGVYICTRQSQAKE